jgi:hypothetical protein
MINKKEIQERFEKARVAIEAEKGKILALLEKAKAYGMSGPELDEMKATYDDLVARADVLEASIREDLIAMTPTEELN